MPFHLNEAPNLALAALTKHKVARGCCCLWSIFWCLPSLCISIGCLDSKDEKENNEYIGCGYPQALSNQEKASLQALRDTLQSLLINKSKVPKESKSELDSVITAQVNNTIQILAKAVSLGNIKHGYLEAIEETLALIKTRFQNEISYRESIKEEIHITGYG